MNKYFSKKDYLKLNYNKKYERPIGMSSNIFDILSEVEEWDGLGKKGKSYCYAFTYYYLQTWLYMYCKYEIIQINFDTPMAKVIKSMIGVSPNNKTFDFITKEGGILDKYNLTKTIPYKQCPVKRYISEEGEVSFTIEEDYYSGIDGANFGSQSVNTKVKEPLLSTRERVIDGELYDGSYSDKRMTFMTDFEVFIYCMKNEDIGFIGFTLYMFMMNNKNKYGKTFGITIDRICKSTKLSKREVYNKISILEYHNMLYVDRSKNDNGKNNTNKYKLQIKVSKFKNSPI